jgi:HK97 family phage prohead protease
MTKKELSKRQLLIPISKSKKGYRGILSASSIDRDNEIIGKSLLWKWSNLEFLPILADHQNDLDNYLGFWKSKRFVEHEGLCGLEVEPQFFSSKANPKAQRVKAMLDEGAQVGLSIGAIPKDHIEKTVDGKEYIEWTDAELLEGSFTPIPSNRDTYANIAKKLNLSNNMEAKMEKSEETPVEAPVESPAEVPAEEPTTQEPEAPVEAPVEEAPTEEPVTPAEPEAPVEPETTPEEKKFTATDLSKAVEDGVTKALKSVPVYAAVQESSELTKSKEATPATMNEILAERAKKRLI